MQVRYASWLVLGWGPGMITSARIDAVKELGRVGWITCLRAPPPSALSPPAAADVPV